MGSQAERPERPAITRVFEVAFAREYAGLCQFALGYVGDQHLAEDVVQDVFVHLWEVVDGNVEAEVVVGRAYLYASVRNRAIGVLKHSRVIAEWSQRVQREAPPPECTPEQELETREMAQAIHDVVDRLPDRARLIFQLSRQHELSYREIAEVLGVTVNTVETQMWRALKRIRLEVGSPVGGGR